MRGTNVFNVRTMHLSDLSFAMNLSYSEGWNQTEKDWRLLLENPGNTCLVVEAGRRIIGTATAMNYGNKVAWIGMVLIDKDFRGEGAGRLILDYLLDKLKNFDSVKLDATMAGHPLYVNSGFRDELIIKRMTIDSRENILSEDINFEIEFITAKTLTEVIIYDENIFGVRRDNLINTLFRNYPEKAFLLRREKIISGYMLGREGNRFNYLGPVFANSSGDAKILISEALKSPDKRPVALDIMQDKEDVTYWLQSIGFSVQRDFSRMYLKSNKFCGTTENQFLIGGPEFG